MSAMIYLRGKKRVTGVWRRLLVGLLALLVLFVIGNWWGGNADLASIVARPFWSIGERLVAGSGGLWQLFSNQERLAAENTALKSRLFELEARLAGQNLLIAENEKLRATLGLAETTGQKIITRIISGSEQGPFDTLLVDAGSAQHQTDVLAPGDLVGLENRLALGRVIEVGVKITKIKLFSAPSNELPVTLGTSATPVKLVGRGLGNFIAEVPRGVAVAVGDEAVFNSYSQDWLVAIVGSIDGNDSETTRKVLLRAPPNLSQLRYVEIYHY